MTTTHRQDCGRLVLARKKGQCIRVGHDCWITVRELRGETVWLAVEAPREVVILRTELETTPGDL